MISQTIYTAGLLAEHEAAAAMLRRALNVTEVDDFVRPSHFLSDDECLNHPTPWTRASFAMRVDRIARWVANECAVVVEKGERLVEVPAVDTLGD